MANHHILIALITMVLWKEILTLMVSLISLLCQILTDLHCGFQNPLIYVRIK